MHATGDLTLYLERGPVHMHPRPVVVAEPLQVLLCVWRQDGALQFSVYCAVAEERREMEQMVRRERARREPGSAANLAREPTMWFKFCYWARSNVGSRQDWSVSLSFLLKLSAAEVFGPNNPDKSFTGILFIVYVAAVFPVSRVTD